MSLGDLRWRLGSASQPGKKQERHTGGPGTSLACFTVPSSPKYFPGSLLIIDPFCCQLGGKTFAKWQDDLARTWYLRIDLLDKVLVAQASQWLVSLKNLRKGRSVLSLASTLG